MNTKTTADAEQALRTILGLTDDAAITVKHVANCAAVATAVVDGEEWRVLVYPGDAFSPGRDTTLIYPPRLPGQ